MNPDTTNYTESEVTLEVIFIFESVNRWQLHKRNNKICKHTPSDLNVLIKIYINIMFTFILFVFVCPFKYSNTLNTLNREFDLSTTEFISQLFCSKRVDLSRIMPTRPPVPLFCMLYNVLSHFAGIVLSGPVIADYVVWALLIVEVTYSC